MAQAKALAKGLLDDPLYAKNLRARLLSGDLSPAMETLLWHYAYGKPADNVNVRVLKPEELSRLPDEALRAIANGEEIPDVGGAPN